MYEQLHQFDDTGYLPNIYEKQRVINTRRQYVTKQVLRTISIATASACAGIVAVFLLIDNNLQLRVVLACLITSAALAAMIIHSSIAVESARQVRERVNVRVPYDDIRIRALQHAILDDPNHQPWRGTRVEKIDKIEHKKAWLTAALRNTPDSPTDKHLGYPKIPLKLFLMALPEEAIQWFDAFLESDEATFAARNFAMPVTDDIRTEIVKKLIADAAPYAATINKLKLEQQQIAARQEQERISDQQINKAAARAAEQAMIEFNSLPLLTTYSNPKGQPPL